MKFYDSPLFSCLLLGEQSTVLRPVLLFVFVYPISFSISRGR